MCSRRLAGARPYCETLDYEDCGSAGCTPQYAGNVSRMAHELAHGNTDYGQNRDVVYAYDLMNRLTNVDDADIDDFDETFAYDPQGRMTAQRRGANVGATSGGEYAYYARSNRLEKVSAGMSDSVDADRHMGADSNFVYDADGNMIGDKSKKMTVTYDWRGLPTEFVREVPSATGIVGEVDTVRLLMTYDGSGSRIGKSYERRNEGDTAWALKLATHYTGLGSEIRENGDGSARVVVNLPQGLGRYGVESASESVANAVPSFEYYLKNHLGSTMLVYGVGVSNSVKAAYDYRAFGEQVDLTVPTDKVTENFTGKERDDETNLGYWGARYLDLALGLWISVDAARQYQNPYLYGGNNPVNRTDPDGNADALGVANTGVHVVAGVSLAGVGTSLCTSILGCAVGIPMVGMGFADVLASPFNLFTDAKNQSWPTEQIVEKLPAGAQDAIDVVGKMGTVKSVADKDILSVSLDAFGGAIDKIINADSPIPLMHTGGLAPADNTSVYDPSY